MTTMLTANDQLPQVSMVPVLRLLDDIGIVEHSNGSTPDPTQGHCTDDAGRALGIAAMIPADLASPVVAGRCLAQLQRSMITPGQFVLRLDERGDPTDHPESDDATARALWGLALATTSSLPGSIRDWSSELLRQFKGFSTPFPRAAAHAIIAGTILLDSPGDFAVAEALLRNNIHALPQGPRRASWSWPEPALTYGNALLADALLHAGQVVGSARLVSEGLEQLGWLVDHETAAEGHFSFTPVDGDDHAAGPAFDQQPLEAWTIASACAKAHSIDPDRRWIEAITRAADWFAGHNDLRVPMWDHETGAAFDGLTMHGPNTNEGAESTLALIGTLVELERVTRVLSSPPVRLRWPKARITDA